MPNPILMADAKSRTSAKQTKTLDAAMAEDLQSHATVESYKMRTGSYFRNPLSPPKDIFVSIPEREKAAANRMPLYQNNLDLIANGIGETTRGVPRHTQKEVLLGHNNAGVK